MKKRLLIFAFAIGVFKLFAQTILIENEGQVFSYEVGIGFQELTCRDSAIAVGFHPDGSLQWVEEEEISPGNIVTTYNESINFCDSDILHTFEHNQIEPIRFVNYIDYLGRRYFEGRESANPGNKVLARYTDLSNEQYEVLYNYHDSLFLLDLIFVDTQVYLFFHGNNEIIVLDDNFDLEYKYLTPYAIFGVTRTQIDCDEFKTFIVAGASDLAGHQTASWQVNGQYMTATLGFVNYYLSLYSFDLINNSATRLGRIRTKELVRTPSVTSRLEFLTSDPNIDMMIDLDRDNSSGLYPYDFQTNATTCQTQFIPITDEDVCIRTSQNLDSIVLVLEGLDPDEIEDLNALGLEDFDFVNRGMGKYVLLPIVNASDGAFANALSKIKYQHRGIQINKVNRIVRIQGYSSGMAGEEITAYIWFGGEVVRSKDSTLVLCEELEIENLSSVLGVAVKGEWIPGLDSGLEFFNSKIDMGSEYIYVSGDDVCGIDTAHLTIVREDRSFDLGPDQEFCFQTDVNLEENVLDGDLVSWGDGQLGLPRLINVEGEYVATLYAEEGCVLMDTVNVLYANETVYDTILLCPLDSIDYNGQVYFFSETISDTLVSVTGCDTLKEIFLDRFAPTIHDVTYLVCGEEGYEVKEDLVLYDGERYVDFKRSDNGCDTIFNITIAAVPRPEPIIFGDTLICFGTETNLSAGEFNEYLWSSGSTDQFIDIGGGEVTLTVVDTLECEGNTNITIVERPEWFVDLIDTLRVDGDSIYDFSFSTESGTISDVQILPKEGLTYEGGNKLSLDGESGVNVYELIFKDDVGCIVKKELVVAYENLLQEKEEVITVPNIIHMNATKLSNTIWKPTFSSDVIVDAIKIYDRWGNQVFYTNEDEGWQGYINGQKALPGVYLYVIKYSVGQEQKVKIGDLTVVR